MEIVLLYYCRLIIISLELHLLNHFITVVEKIKSFSSQESGFRIIEQT
jgi:hypothetical protein